MMLVNDKTSRYIICETISKAFGFPIKYWKNRHENITCCPLCHYALKISAGENGDNRLECHAGCHNHKIYAAINRKSADMKNRNHKL